jgi:hypothetical protein
MIVADCCSARTPILARNSVFGTKPQSRNAVASGLHPVRPHPALTQWMRLTVYSRSRNEITLRLASNRSDREAVS